MLLGWLLRDGGRATCNYLTVYLNNGIKYRFNYGLREAFLLANRLRGQRQVRVSAQVPIPYIHAAYYLHYPPARFQRKVQMKLVGNEYQVSKLEAYVVDEHYLTPGRPYVYLSRYGELEDDAQHHKVVVYHDDLWEVGTMQVQGRAHPLRK